MTSRIRLSSAGEGIQLVQIDHPKSRNSLNDATYADLVDVLERASKDPAIQVLILSGTEKFFTAGNDLADFQTLTNSDASEVPGITFLRHLQSFNKPVVAAVEGFAIGIGSTLLMHCDFAFAGTSTRFSLPFVKLGLCAEGATTCLLPRLAGSKGARELLMLGETFTADRAHVSGLLTTVVPDGEAKTHAIECAEKLTRLPRESLLATKALLQVEESNRVIAAFDREEKRFLELCRTEEAQNAFATFFQSRKGPS